MGSHRLAKYGAVRGKKVDNAVGDAGLLEDLEDEVVGEDGRVAGLPECNIALKNNRITYYNAASSQNLYKSL